MNQKLTLRNIEVLLPFLFKRQVEEIAKNSMEFARRHLMPENIFCYYYILFKVPSLCLSLCLLSAILQIFGTFGGQWGLFIKMATD